MMRKFLALFVGVAALALATGAGAEEKKKDDKKTEKAGTKTLEGTLVCGKCKLGETDSCSQVLLVKDGDKEVKYFLNDKGGKEKYHGKICKADKEAKVTGKVVEKDGKKTIDSPKVEFKDDAK
jgi:hypothetical protein